METLDIITKSIPVKSEHDVANYSTGTETNDNLPNGSIVQTDTAGLPHLPQSYDTVPPLVPTSADHISAVPNIVDTTVATDQLAELVQHQMQESYSPPLLDSHPKMNDHTTATIQPPNPLQMDGMMPATEQHNIMPQTPLHPQSSYNMMPQGSVYTNTKQSTAKDFNSYRYGEPQILTPPVVESNLYKNSNFSYDQSQVMQTYDGYQAYQSNIPQHHGNQQLYSSQMYGSTSSMAQTSMPYMMSEVDIYRSANDSYTVARPSMAPQVMNTGIATYIPQQTANPYSPKMLYQVRQPYPASLDSSFGGDDSFDDEDDYINIDHYMDTDPEPQYSVDMTERPESLQEAISMYIDFLIWENEKKTKISQCTLLDVGFDFTKEDYFRDVVCRSVPFPTAKFRKWLKLFHVDIEITDPEGNVMPETRFGDGVEKPEPIIAQPKASPPWSWNNQYTKPENHTQELLPQHLKPVRGRGRGRGRGRAKSYLGRFGPEYTYTPRQQYRYPVNNGSTQFYQELPHGSYQQSPPNFCQYASPGNLPTPPSLQNHAMKKQGMLETSTTTSSSIGSALPVSSIPSTLRVTSQEQPTIYKYSAISQSVIDKDSSNKHVQSMVILSTDGSTGGKVCTDLKPCTKAPGMEVINQDAVSTQKSPANIAAQNSTTKIIAVSSASILPSSSSASRIYVRTSAKKLTPSNSSIKLTPINSATKLVPKNSTTRLDATPMTDQSPNILTGRILSPAISETTVNAYNPRKSDSCTNTEIVASDCDENNNVEDDEDSITTEVADFACQTDVHEKAKVAVKQNSQDVARQSRTPVDKSKSKTLVDKSRIKSQEGSSRHQPERSRTSPRLAITEGTRGASNIIVIQPQIEETIIARRRAKVNTEERVKLEKDDARSPIKTRKRLRSDNASADLNKRKK